MTFRRAIVFIVFVSMSFLWNGSLFAEENPIIVNINSRTNNLQNPAQVFLTAGTYEVTPIGVENGGAFDAWSAWARTTCTNTAGCPRTNPTSARGMLNIYTVISPDLVAVKAGGVDLIPMENIPQFSGSYFVSNPTLTMVFVEDGMVYPDALTALSNALTSVFSLHQDGMVGFSNTDFALSDNRGGMSLMIAEVKQPEPIITVFPESFDFGHVAITTASDTQSFTVSNVGTSDLSLGTIEATSSDFIIMADTCSDLTIPPGETCEVDIVFTPATPGAKVATLLVPSNDPNRPVLEVVVAGEGAEGPPPMTLEKVMLNFHDDVNRGRFIIKGTVELTGTDNGIDPLDEDIVATIGSASVVIPAGFLVEDDGTYMFNGAIGGVEIMVRMQQADLSSVRFIVVAKKIELTDATNPTNVSLSIGDDLWTTTIRMKGKLIYKQDVGGNDDASDTRMTQ